MNISKIMIAAIALCGVSQAMAAGVTRLTGASASSVNVARAAKVLCTNAGGTYTLYKTTTSTSSLGNQFTGVCSVDFENTTLDQVRVNVAGGSETAVINAALGGNVATGFLAPTGACTALGAGTGSLAFLAAGEMRSCGTTLADNTTSNGGFLDVEGQFFNAAYSAEDFASAGFSQVFGVAVNTTLYNALQAFQKTAAGGNLVPAACAAGDVTAACQPSLSKAQINTLINNSTGTSSAKRQGGAFLTGSGTTAITYCMRPQTSGTQQAAQLYFLNYGGNGTLGGKQPIVPAGTSLSVSGTVRYAAVSNSGSGDVRNCLNDAAGYRFGVLSAENNPIGGSDSYRFVRVNEVAAAEGVAGSSQTATAIAGRYDFVYETVAYCPGGTCDPFIDAIAGVLPAGASTPGLFLTGVESKFGRGGNSAVPYSSR